MKMKSLCSVFLLVFAAAGSNAATPIPTVEMPQLREVEGTKQLFVDGAPFIVFGGEVHNSSASSKPSIETTWDRLKTLNANTVLTPVSWELLEPQEGHYDFSLVDYQIEAARAHGLRVVFLWFGSWKNGDSTYTPMWVKTDRKRFPVQVRDKSAAPEQNQPPLSPLAATSMEADAKAYQALMRHIRGVDADHTVIMMQIENEVGLLGDSRDRSAQAQAAWNKPVPRQLLDYLTKNKKTLGSEVEQVWGRNGSKTSGTWAEVFGTDVWADEVFMAWNYATYIETVAKRGKAENNLPMYVNAWLGPQPDGLTPGKYPSGGPVARVMDIWRAAAPSLDMYAPDIYVDDFKGVVAEYGQRGNPLFIPEARGQVGNLYWAMGKGAALGWSVFGYEDFAPGSQVSESFGILKNAMAPLAKWQSENKIASVLLQKGESSQDVSLGGYRITFSSTSSLFGYSQNTDGADAQLLAGGVSLSTRALRDDERPFGIVINTAPDEFVILGSNISPKFTLESSGGEKVAIGSVDEGRFADGEWIPGRRLNGDELYPTVWIGKQSAIKIKLYRFRD